MVEPQYTYLVNPGSVGQPRDGDPQAAYAIYSAEDHVVEFRRVAYNAAAAAEKIRRPGSPIRSRRACCKACRGMSTGGTACPTVYNSLLCRGGAGGSACRLQLQRLSTPTRE